MLSALRKAMVAFFATTSSCSGTTRACTSSSGTAERRVPPPPRPARCQKDQATLERACRPCRAAGRGRHAAFGLRQLALRGIRAREEGLARPAIRSRWRPRRGARAAGKHGPELVRRRPGPPALEDGGRRHRPRAHGPEQGTEAYRTAALCRTARRRWPRAIRAAKATAGVEVTELSEGTGLARRRRAGLLAAYAAMGAGRAANGSVELHGELDSPSAKRARAQARRAPPREALQG